jgi:ribosomal protein S12 methylthiotransferase
VSRKTSNSPAPDRLFVSVVGLGCPKNQVDTENLLGELVKHDVVLCPDPGDASVVIVNTCGFIAPAREEGSEVLAECVELRRRGPCRLLVVAGCWVEREAGHLKTRYPEVDLWVGLLTDERIRWLVGRALEGKETPAYPADRPHSLLAESGRLRLTPAHWAYLKIADGCDNRCAYCTIPEIRGPLRSKSKDAVVEEVKVLAGEGVKEVCLVAQDITAYGHDLGGKPDLVGLLKDIAGVHGIEWIRLLYTHPAHFTAELIDLIAEEPKICRYVDVPIQHISDHILKRMGRKVTSADIRLLVHTLRERIRDIVIRTTVLAGFPGETTQEFDELCGFLREERFERLGCFAYSPEVGTPAAQLPGLLPQAERLRRADEIMLLQRQIAFEIAKSWVGRELSVIVDRPGRRLGSFVGRTYADAPDIDPVIYLTGVLRAGEIRRARVTGARGYDLAGIV